MLTYKFVVINFREIKNTSLVLGVIENLLCSKYSCRDLIFIDFIICIINIGCRLNNFFDIIFCY